MISIIYCPSLSVVFKTRGKPCFIVMKISFDFENISPVLVITQQAEAGKT